MKKYPVFPKLKQSLFNVPQKIKHCFKMMIFMQIFFQATAHVFCKKMKIFGFSFQNFLLW